MTKFCYKLIKLIELLIRVVLTFLTVASKLLLALIKVFVPLDDKVQIIIQDGEIRILDVTATVKQNQDAGWEVFLSLEKNAPQGEITNVSTNHDNYLYQK